MVLRMMDKVFFEQIGKNLKVYIYDMMVKIKERRFQQKYKWWDYTNKKICQHVLEPNSKLNKKNSKCSFAYSIRTYSLSSIRKYNMCLNPTKCSFKVQEGNLLSFILINDGIVPNPYKCQDIINMRSSISVTLVIF